MSDIRRHVYNECDPIRAAELGQYTDLSAVRGAKTLLKDIAERLDMTDHDKSIALITVHSGCGKSSDLKYLSSRLSHTEATQRFTANRYFPVIIDIEQYVDKNDASLSEILLSTVSELSYAFKEELDIELRDPDWEKRVHGVIGLMTSGNSPEKIELGLPGFKAQFSLKTASHIVKDEVRKKLDRDRTSMIEEINKIRQVK